MARIRSLKPDFFKDEDVHALPLEERLLFQGLWLLADREGRLEDRPRYIHSEIFPYDPNYNLSAMIQHLHDEDFVDRYEIKGKKYIQIKNFLKHQRPNSREPKSEIPARASTRKHARAQEEGEGEGEGKGNKEGEGKGKECADALTPLAELFLSRCPDLPRIESMSRSRREKEKSRLREKPDMAWWAKVFDKAQASSFCRGENDRGWKLTFDWILANDSNALKVYEGKYDGKRNPRTADEKARANVAVCDEWADRPARIFQSHEDTGGLDAESGDDAIDPGRPLVVIGGPDQGTA